MVSLFSFYSIKNEILFLLKQTHSHRWKQQAMNTKEQRDEDKEDEKNGNYNKKKRKYQRWAQRRRRSTQKKRKIYHIIYLTFPHFIFIVRINYILLSAPIIHFKFPFYFFYFFRFFLRCFFLSVFNYIILSISLFKEKKMFIFNLFQVTII